MFTDPVGTALPVRLSRARVPSCLPPTTVADIYTGQPRSVTRHANFDCRCVYRSGWNCVATPRRATASRHGLPPTTIARHRRRRPGRLRPGAQPSLFTRAKCEPRTPLRVISSPTVGAFTSGLTQPVYARAAISHVAILATAILTTHHV
jgi:hypothetical protein